jgi:hypothetical protein
VLDCNFPKQKVMLHDNNLIDISKLKFTINVGNQCWRHLMRFFVLIQFRGHVADPNATGRCYVLNIFTGKYGNELGYGYFFCRAIQ